jgi:hypothetical protein
MTGSTPVNGQRITAKEKEKPKLRFMSAIKVYVGTTETMSERKKESNKK